MPKRIGFNQRGKAFKLTDEMIGLRDNLARGLGFVLRPCSIGGSRECWEKPDLDAIYRGKMISVYHAVRYLEIDGEHHYVWPEQAEIAAWAIDKGKAAKQEKTVPLFGEEADV